MRPDILRLVPVAALALNVASQYAPEESSIPVPSPRPLPRSDEMTPSLISSQVALRNRRILETYPELKSFPLNQLVELNNLAQKTTIYNFSSLRFSQAGLSELFGYLDHLRAPVDNFGLNITPGYLLRIEPRNRQRDLLIVPTEAPNPFWVPDERTVTSRIDGKPVAFTDMITNISLVRSVPESRLGQVSFYSPNMLRSKSAENFLQILFITEACQGSVDIALSSSKTQSPPAISSQGLGLEQELVCNGIGEAMLHRIAGQPYSEYYKFIKSVIHVSTEAQIDPAVVSRDEYQKMPSRSLLE